MKNKKLGKNAGNPLVAILVIGIMVIAFASLSGCIDQEITEVIKCPTFDITPTGSATGILSSAKDKYTIPAYANTTGYTIIQTDNSTAWADPVFTFEVEPVTASQDWDADQGATIFYEVSEPEIKISTSTDEYYLVTKTGGNRQWVFQEGDSSAKTTKYGSGSAKMLLTGNTTIILTPDINQDSFARIEDTHDAVSVNIIFSNGCGWTETYRVDFQLDHIW